MTKLFVNESVLDQPKDGLDPDVWQDSPDGGKPVLTEESAQKIGRLLEWVQDQYQFQNLSVYLIGSICSNSWSRDSDIDIDFCASGATTNDQDEEVVKEFGWNFKKNFIDNYMNAYPEYSKIGTHPFEVYFNRPMNTKVIPQISFGVISPYIQHPVSETVFGFSQREISINITTLVHAFPTL